MFERIWIKKVRVGFVFAVLLFNSSNIPAYAEEGNACTSVQELSQPKTLGQSSLETLLSPPSKVEIGQDERNQGSWATWNGDISIHYLLNLKNCDPGKNRMSKKSGN